MKIRIGLGILLVLALGTPPAAQAAERCSLTLCLSVRTVFPTDEWCTFPAGGHLSCVISAHTDAFGSDRTQPTGIGLGGEVQMTARMLDCSWVTDTQSGSCLAGPTAFHGWTTWGPESFTDGAGIGTQLSTLRTRIPIGIIDCVTISATVELAAAAWHKIDTVQFGRVAETTIDTGGFTLCVD